jgi:hypothetical protein
LENGEFANGQPSPGKRTWLNFVGFLIAAGIGTVAALAWKSHGDVAKETIGPTPSLKQMSFDLEVMRQSIDAPATSTATNQAQMIRSIDQLAAGQEHMTREITEMQTVERYVLDKISTPTAAVPKPALRPSQAPTAVNPAKSPQTCLEVLPNALRFALGPPKSACRYSMPADQSDANIHSKPASSRACVR